jgi:hypothetical protein
MNRKHVTRHVPFSDHRPLAPLAKAAQSEGSSVAARALRRQVPEVGAECPNGARSVLCGGRSVMSVPTAISDIRARTNAPSHSITSFKRGDV